MKHSGKTTVFQGEWADDVAREATSLASSGGEEGYKQGRILIMLMLYPLDIGTHRLMARTFPFRETDISLYASRLINDHGCDALSLVEELLLRTDLDFGSYQANDVLRKLVALNHIEVAKVATTLLGTIEVELPRLVKSGRWTGSFVHDDGPQVAHRVWRLVENIAGITALAYRETADPVPGKFYPCFMMTCGPAKQIGRLLGLDLFFHHLEPRQTEDLLLAILNAGDGVKFFGAAVREQGVPRAKEHSQALYNRLNKSGRDAMRESGWMLW